MPSSISAGSALHRPSLVLYPDVVPLIRQRSLPHLARILGGVEYRETRSSPALPKAFEAVSPAKLKELGFSTNAEEMLASGIFQEPIANEPVLQTMFEEVKAGL